MNTVVLLFGIVELCSYERCSFVFGLAGLWSYEYCSSVFWNSGALFL